jgi:hypothetical protein
VCHVSVGHLARLLEKAEIATVIIAVKAFRPRMEPMQLPRVLFTPYPMGRPVGAPGDVDSQRVAVEMALDLLSQARGGGTMTEFEGQYRPMWRKA